VLQKPLPALASISTSQVVWPLNSYCSGAFPLFARRNVYPCMDN
jgi:hypothetical protein